jgi:uncharacterized protein with PIN domain
MKTLYQKFLDDNKIPYSYLPCPYCHWKIYLINPSEHKFEMYYNYLPMHNFVTNCPKCGKIHVC